MVLPTKSELIALTEKLNKQEELKKEQDRQQRLEERREREERRQKFIQTVLSEIERAYQTGLLTPSWTRSFNMDSLCPYEEKELVVSKIKDILREQSILEWFLLGLDSSRSGTYLCLSFKK